MDNDIFSNNRDFMTNNQTGGRSDNRENRQDGNSTNNQTNNQTGGRFDNRDNRQDGNSSNTQINNQTGGGSDNRDNRQDGNSNNNTQINDQTGGDKVKTIVTLPKIKESVDNLDKKIDSLDKKIENLKIVSGDSSSAALKPIEDKINRIEEKNNLILKYLTQLCAE